ncbi:MAG: heme A synthase [Bacteriovoracia bacterium]
MPFIAWLTLGFTYLLMVWGNIVSSTGSGLACPDWPLCHGTITPPARPDIILEWGHRLLAATTTTLILISLVWAWRLSRKSSGENPLGKATLKRSLGSILGLLAIQIPLGGLTVYLGLSVIASTVHLVIAHVVLGLIILLACALTWKEGLALPRTQPSLTKLSKYATMAVFGILIQIALGGLVRHSGFGLACPLFPNCQPDSFFPTPFIASTALAFLHRWWGVLLAVLFLLMAREGQRTMRGPLENIGNLPRLANATTVLVLLQIGLGVATVFSALHTHMRALHAAIGYGLFGLTFYIALRSGSFTWLWRKRSGVDPARSTRLPTDGVWKAV